MAERQFELEPRSDESPDRIFDRRWALTLLEHAQARLSQEYAAAGKADRYCELEGFLPGDRSSSKTYAEAGAAVGASEGAVKVEVHRMKKRFGEILRDEIAHTVASEQEIEEEIRYLMMSVTS
jgi:RNA polymerase sigma-70 factor (ECF subfamily)